MALLGIRAAGGPAPVHREYRAGDKAGLLGEQVRDRVGDFGGSADPAERMQLSVSPSMAALAVAYGSAPRTAR